MILGLLSLIFWTLVIVTSLKYAMFAMRIGNRGEGGIMALMSLLVSRRKSRPLVLFAGLFGAALITATAPSRRPSRCSPPSRG